MRFSNAKTRGESEVPRIDPHPDKARVDRKALAVFASFAELEADDRKFQKSQSWQSRLRTMELLRRINYGDATTGRLQRVLEVVQSPAR